MAKQIYLASEEPVANLYIMIAQLNCTFINHMHMRRKSTHIINSNVHICFCIYMLFACAVYVILDRLKYSITIYKANTKYANVAYICIDYNVAPGVYGGLTQKW